MSPTLIVLPRLPPELILPMTTMPPSTLELARPPLPAEATRPARPCPPRPYRLRIGPRPRPLPPLPPFLSSSLPVAAARLPLPPEASPIAVPPPASILRLVLLSTLPPSMEPAPHAPYPPPMSPTLIVFPWFPPELILPITTMPPSALACARPPFPADTVSPPMVLLFSAATRLARRPMWCTLFFRSFSSLLLLLPLSPLSLPLLRP